MKHLNKDEVREAVRGHYGKTAEGCCGGPVPKETDACCVADAEAKAEGEGGCGCDNATPSSDNNITQGACCSGPALSPDETSKALGYSSDALASLPEGANLGLGCGNPQAIASIKK